MLSVKCMVHSKKFWGKGVWNIRPESSYMAESMIVLPVFVTFMTVLLFFFRILQVQQLVDNAMIQTGRELSVAAYETPIAGISGNSISAEVLMQKYLKENGISNRFISGGNLGISLLRSDFEGSYITLVADYQMQIPVFLLGKHNIAITQQVKCRKWTGRDEKSGESGEEIVYITPTGTVYHKNTGCTYLNMKVKSILADQIEGSRNEEGSKYYACSKCKKFPKGNVVYVTAYGNRYHTRRDCSKIQRTIQAVFLSEVGDRHGCSKCS